jgi:hypothetical protein
MNCSFYKISFRRQGRALSGCDTWIAFGSIKIAVKASDCGATLVLSQIIAPLEIALGYYWEVSAPSARCR